jgi:hypothetical protein
MHLASTRTEFREPISASAAAEPVVPSGLLRWARKVFAVVAAGRWTGAQAGVQKHMSLVETLHVGPKKQVLLVSCDGEHFLVGTGPDSVDTIVRVKACSLGLQSADRERN